MLDRRSVVHARAACAITLGTLAAPGMALAQSSGMAGMAGMHHDAPARVSAVARRQIDSVEKAVRPYAATEAAAAAGFHSAFGWLPTMGTHWVRTAQMLNGRQTDRLAPSQLMFSPIAGKDSLVGIAYAYVTAENDTVRPALFDGSPGWHEHADLGPPGTTLVMLHVWFVPSPDGVFAGTNPNLPFWAAGLAAPDSARMHDPAFSARVRRAALALGAIVDTSSVLARLERIPRVRVAIDARRDSVRSLIPELRAAEKAKDAVRWNRAAEQTAAQWDGMYAAYLAGARSDESRERIRKYVAMLLGEHEH